MPGAARDPKPNRQIRSLVLCVDLVGSRRIWPAHVGWVVDLVGSRRVPSDRLDDQTDDQAAGGAETSATQTTATTVELAPDIPSGDAWWIATRTTTSGCRGQSQSRRVGAPMRKRTCSAWASDDIADCGLAI